MSRPTPESAAPRTGSAAALAGRWLARFRIAPLLLRRDGVWDGHQAWSGFEAWCSANAGRSSSVALSSALLHELVCDADLPLADDAATLAWARPLLLHLHGDVAQGWPLAAWQDGATRGVSVLHGVSLRALNETARAHGIRLLALRPWWALVLHRALHRQPALQRGAARLLVLEGCCVTDLALQDGCVSALQIRRLDEATHEALDAWCAASPGAEEALAVGYGLNAGHCRGVRAAEPLDAPAPALHWLTGLRA